MENRIQFCKPEISTLTAKAELLVGDLIIDKINILQLARKLQPSEVLNFIKYSDKDGTLIIKKWNDNIETGKPFNNCCSIGIQIYKNRKPINIKFFSNGEVQIAGLNTIAQIDVLLMRMCTLLWDVDISIFSINNMSLSTGIIRSKIKNICTIMCDIHIKNEIIIDQFKFYNLVQNLNLSNMTCLFENQKTKQLQLHVKFNTWETLYIIFTTGHIKIYKTKSENELNMSIDYIKNFINKYYKKFIICDDIGRMINILKTPFDEALSPEWFKKRINYITASESYYAILNNPPYKSREDFIRTKIQSRKHTRYKTHPTEIMQHGIMMEYIAKKHYENSINSNNKLEYYIKIWDVGFHTRGICGSTPDGCIMKFRKFHNTSRHTNATNRKTKGMTLKDIESLSVDNLNTYRMNGILFETCLIEIKCPSNFKNVNDLKKDYPHYYCQIQTQLYVLKIPSCVFLTNKIVKFSQESDWKLDMYKNKNNNKYGIFVQIFMNDDSIKYLYPRDIYNCSRASVKNDINFQMKKSSIYTRQSIKSYKYIYWKFITSKRLVIYRQHEWFNRKKIKIQQIYQEIYDRRNENINDLFTPETDDEWDNVLDY